MASRAPTSCYYNPDIVNSVKNKLFAHTYVVHILRYTAREGCLPVVRPFLQRSGVQRELRARRRCGGPQLQQQ
eukprot:5912843-Pyramimonas_sp.AAC.2